MSCLDIEPESTRLYAKTVNESECVGPNTDSSLACAGLLFFSLQCKRLTPCLLHTHLLAWNTYKHAEYRHTYHT